MAPFAASFPGGGGDTLRRGPGIGWLIRWLIGRNLDGLGGVGPGRVGWLGHGEAAPLKVKG